jgi:hypothetical protein
LNKRKFKYANIKLEIIKNKISTNKGTGQQPFPPSICVNPSSINTIRTDENAYIDNPFTDGARSVASSPSGFTSTFNIPFISPYKNPKPSFFYSLISSESNPHR